MGIIVLIMLFVIICALLSMEVTLRKQLKQTKDVEDAIYRLIEIVKQQNKP